MIISGWAVQEGHCLRGGHIFELFFQIVVFVALK